MMVMIANTDRHDVDNALFVYSESKINNGSYGILHNCTFIYAYTSLL